MGLGQVPGTETPGAGGGARAGARTALVLVTESLSADSRVGTPCTAWILADAGPACGSVAAELGSVSPRRQLFVVIPLGDKRVPSRLLQGRILNPSDALNVSN